MIGTIANRELYSIFVSPLAWSILAVLQAILAWIFFIQTDNFISIQAQLATMGQHAPGVTDVIVIPLFSLASFLLLLVMPLISMRLISEERCNHTLALLISSPIAVSHIILGKFLALLAFIASIVLLLLLMSLSLSLGTQLDYGQIAATTLGLLLMLSTFAAIGLYVSCLSKHPTTAAIITFGILFILWIINWAVLAVSAELQPLLAWLSIMQHQEAFQRGLVNSSDVCYYVLVTSLFLLLSIRRLDAERLQSDS